MNKIALILTCSAVTLLPRIIPYFASSFLSRLPAFIRKCMMLLPVASLGALIFRQGADGVAEFFDRFAAQGEAKLRMGLAQVQAR